MDFDGSEKDIARELAQDLSADFGEGVAAETEKRLSGDGQSTRMFGMGLSEAATVAGLLLSCIQIAMQCYSDKRMDQLLTKLDAEAPKPEKLSEEKRRSILQRVADKFLHMHKA